MITYTKAGIFIDECGDDPREGVRRCNLVINGLFKAMIDCVTDSGISEYTLDDGQTKITQAYRNPTEIQRSIDAFIKLKHYYLNQINGNIIGLVDGRNLTRFNNGRS